MLNTVLTLYCMRVQILQTLINNTQQHVYLHVY